MIGVWWGSSNSNINREDSKDAETRGEMLFQIFQTTPRSFALLAPLRFQLLLPEQQHQPRRHERREDSRRNAVSNISDYSAILCALGASAVPVVVSFAKT
jgi:hypothetical protein